MVKKCISSLTCLDKYNIQMKVVKTSLKGKMMGCFLLYRLHELLVKYVVFFVSTTYDSVAQR